MIQGFLINMPQFLPPAQVIIHFLSKNRWGKKDNCIPLEGQVGCGHILILQETRELQARPTQLLVKTCLSLG
jgi:hypothetical protein